MPVVKFWQRRFFPDPRVGTCTGTVDLSPVSAAIASSIQIPRGGVHAVVGNQHQPALVRSGERQARVVNNLRGTELAPGPGFPPILGAKNDHMGVVVSGCNQALS